MTDKQEEIATGQHARQLLDDEVLQQAFASAEDRFMRHWKDSRPEDDVGREKMYFAIQGLELLKKELKILLDNGTKAARELEQEK